MKKNKKIFYKQSELTPLIRIAKRTEKLNKPVWRIHKLYGVLMGSLFINYLAVELYKMCVIFIISLEKTKSEGLYMLPTRGTPQAPGAPQASM